MFAWIPQVACFNIFFVILHPNWHGQCLGKYFNLPRWLEYATAGKFEFGNWTWGKIPHRWNFSAPMSTFASNSSLSSRDGGRRWNTINTALKHASSCQLLPVPSLTKTSGLQDSSVVDALFTQIWMRTVTLKGALHSAGFLGVLG